MFILKQSCHFRTAFVIGPPSLHRPVLTCPHGCCQLNEMLQSIISLTLSSHLKLLTLTMLSEKSLLSSVLWEMESPAGALTELRHPGAARVRRLLQLTRRNSLTCFMHFQQNNKREVIVKKTLHLLFVLSINFVFLLLHNACLHPFLFHYY